jgi:hypothetical protein
MSSDTLAAALEADLGVAADLAARGSAGPARSRRGCGAREPAPVQRSSAAR